MRVRLLAMSFVLGVLACIDFSGPLLVRPVMMAVNSPSTPFPLSVTGGLQTIVVQGGPGLSCGVSAASGQAFGHSGQLVIQLTFRPFDPCPFAPTDGRYTATVARVPSGWYDVEAHQHYWADRPDTTIRARVYVQP